MTDRLFSSVCIVVVITLLSASVLCPGCSVFSDTSHVDPPAYPTPVSAWPMGGHDCRNSAVSEYAGPRNPKILWKFATRATPNGGFAVDQRGNIIAGQYGVDYLSPFGELLWRNDLIGGNPINDAPAVGADGTIYVASGYDGTLFALSPDDGHIIWHFKGGSAETGPTIGPDGTIFLATYGNARAINPDGTSRWAYFYNYVFTAQPAVDRWGNSYFPNVHRYVFSFDPDGNLRWQFFDLAGFKSPGVIGENDVLYVHALSQKVYALDCRDGSLLWELQLDSGYSEAQLGLGPSGTIYVLAQEGIFAIDPSGFLKWHVLGFCTFGQLVIDRNENIYLNQGVNGVGSEDNISSLSSSGDLLWGFYLGAGEITTGIALDSRGVLYYGMINANVHDPNLWYFIAVGDSDQDYDTP